MDLQVVTQNYPSSTGNEPLLFLAAGATTAIARVVPRFYPMREYDYLGDWPVIIRPSVSKPKRPAWQTSKAQLSYVTKQATNRCQGLSPRLLLPVA